MTINANEKERPTEKGYFGELPGNKNVLFPVPLTRWEKYQLAKFNLRKQRGGEVFFERGTGGKDIQNLEPGAGQANRRYDTKGISPTIPTTGGGRHIPMIHAILTPQRPTKRQNGRRIKKNGEPSFTLTSQDIHGVIISNAETDTE